MWSWWEDPGAVGVNNVYESDVNLSFGLKFNDILKLNGYDTVLTRNDKNDIADKSLDTIAKRKKSDMYKRLDIYNSSLKNVAISIHQNIFLQSLAQVLKFLFKTKSTF